MKNKDEANSVLNFMDLKHIRYKILYWTMFALLLIAVLVCVLPVIWVFLSGFKTTAEMYSQTPTLFPEHIDLSMAVNVWKKISFGSAYANSLFICIGGTLLDICVNGIFGYVLSKVKPKGSAIVNTAIFWSMMLPGISMVPLYMTFVDMPVIHVNLQGTYFPLWLKACCNAFNVLLFKSFFDGIPISYMESAKIDGCTNLGIFFRIIMPLSKAIIMVVAIFSITNLWSDFMWPYLILGNTKLETVAVKLYQLSNDGFMQDNERMLAVMFSIVPVLVVFAFFSKHIIGGIDIGGVKG